MLQHRLALHHQPPHPAHLVLARERRRVLSAQLPHRRQFEDPQHAPLEARQHLLPVVLQLQRAQLAHRRVRRHHVHARRLPLRPRERKVLDPRVRRVRRVLARHRPLRPAHHHVVAADPRVLAAHDVPPEVVQQADPVRSLVPRRLHLLRRRHVLGRVPLVRASRQRLELPHRIPLRQHPVQRRGHRLRPRRRRPRAPHKQLLRPHLRVRRVHVVAVQRVLLATAQPPLALHPRAAAPAALHRLHRPREAPKRQQHRHRQHLPPQLAPPHHEHHEAARKERLQRPRQEARKVRPQERVELLRERVEAVLALRPPLAQRHVPRHHVAPDARQARAHRRVVAHQLQQPPQLLRRGPRGPAPRSARPAAARHPPALFYAGPRLSRKHAPAHAGGPRGPQGARGARGARRPLQSPVRARRGRRAPLPYITAPRA